MLKKLKIKINKKRGNSIELQKPNVEVEIKPQFKPRGSVSKEEDPKTSHQLYKLQIKSTQSTRQTLCLWII